MNYQTSEQLAELRLNAMRQEYARQEELPAMNDLSFDERLEMLVNAQYTARMKTKVARLIRSADLREPGANLSSVDYSPERNLNKSVVAKLSDCQWVTNGTNLIITGATGVGKTYLASAFGRAACEKGLTVKSFRVTRLLTDLAISRGDGSYNRLMKDLTKPTLLILDDFGMKQMDLASSQDFLEVIEERHFHQRSLIISAQLPVKDWPSVFKDLTIADAVLDRIVHNAYRFELKGPSRRPSVEEPMAASTEDDKPIEPEYTDKQ